MNVTEKLRQLRIRAGLSQALMAKKIGLKGQSSYQRYESADDFHKTYLPYELVEKLIPLLEGKGNPPISLSEILSLAGRSVIEAFASSRIAFPSITAEKIPLFIPILEWTQVRMWLSQELVADEIKRYTAASHVNPEENSFALRIRDNSMSPDNFNPGDIIVCDPDKPYHPGLIVLALASAQDEPVIGRYHLQRARHRGELAEIVPSNLAWPRHSIDRGHADRILGRVVEHRAQL